MRPEAVAVDATPSLDKEEHPSRARKMLARLRKGTRAVVDHAVTHTGVGIVCAVAYFDP